MKKVCFCQQIKQIEQIFECAKNDLREFASICVLILVDTMGDDTHFHLWWRTSLMVSAGNSRRGRREKLWDGTLMNGAVTVGRCTL